MRTSTPRTQVITIDKDVELQSLKMELLKERSNQKQLIQDYNNLCQDYNELYCQFELAQHRIRSLQLDLQKTQLKQQETKKKQNRTLTFIIVLLCVISLGWTGITLSTQYNEAQVPHSVVDLAEKIDESSNKKYLKIDWETMQDKYPNIVGWIYIPDTNISHPIMYKKGSSDYYLTHNPENSPNNLGSIFIDGSQSHTMEDKNTIIYGHSISITGGMFTDIEKWNDEKWFNKHKEFYILTPSNTYKVNVRLFAETVDYSSYYTIDSESDWKGVLKQQESDARYINKDVKVDEKSNLITLSTCHLGYDGSRFVLQGDLQYFMGQIELP